MNQNNAPPIPPGIILPNPAGQPDNPIFINQNPGEVLAEISEDDEEGEPG